MLATFERVPGYGSECWNSATRPWRSRIAGCLWHSNCTTITVTHASWQVTIWCIQRRFPFTKASS